MSLLRVKSLIVGTPIEGIVTSLRWYLGFVNRFRFPEMCEAYLEERRLPAVLRKLLPRRDANCVDVGCHIGSFLNLLVRMFPEGRHVAIEASPRKAAWLQNKFLGAVIHNVAVAAVPGTATYEDNLRLPGYSRLVNTGDRGEGNSYYDVNVTTLDDLLLTKIDLLKIDIEGGELSALKGATKTIAGSRPIILFEVGSEYALEKIHVSRRELYDLLTEHLGYSIYTFTDILFDKEAMEFGEFRKCGTWPFRAFNFVAKPGSGEQIIGSHG